MRHQGTGDSERISAKSLPPSSCKSFSRTHSIRLDGRFRETASNLGQAFDATNCFSATMDLEVILLSTHEHTRSPATVDTEVKELRTAAGRKGFHEANETIIGKGVATQIQLLQVLQRL